MRRACKQVLKIKREWQTEREKEKERGVTSDSEVNRRPISRGWRLTKEKRGILRERARSVSLPLLLKIPDPSSFTLLTKEETSSLWSDFIYLDYLCRWIISRKFAIIKSDMTVIRYASFASRKKLILADPRKCLWRLSLPELIVSR